ncbi:MAG: hypothetical protein M0C28_28485 [Candidatus Moduliflexus flocculans]|nr:hypothetical protein [Candidatus Moduliflexus flocculans]
MSCCWPPLLGMNLMAASADLVMLYLAIETTSIPLYVLAGFLLADDKSTEVGLQVPALWRADLRRSCSTVSAWSSALPARPTSTQLADMLQAGQPAFDRVLGVLSLILVGLGFKVSLVPFHFWAPDVYEGAPTPVAGFLSTASKAAGFAVLLRLFFVAFPDFAASTGRWSLRSFPPSP